MRTTVIILSIASAASVVLFGGLLNAITGLPLDIPPAYDAPAPSERPARRRHGRTKPTNAAGDAEWQPGRLRPRCVSRDHSDQCRKASPHVGREVAGPHRDRRAGEWEPHAGCVHHRLAGRGDECASGHRAVPVRRSGGRDSEVWLPNRPRSVKPPPCQEGSAAPIREAIVMLHATLVSGSCTAPTTLQVGT